MVKQLTSTIKIERGKHRASLLLWLIFCVALLGKGSFPKELDPFGGLASVKLKATGFFRVEKIRGRWWLVSPEGHPFFSKGVNHINPDGFYAPALGFSPYRRNILQKYGDEEGWRNATTKRLIEWGFNTIGTWSGKVPSAFGLPYIVMFDCAGADWEHGSFPDVFSLKWEADVRWRGTQSTKGKAMDPYLLGYFTDNELHWEMDWRGTQSLLEVYLSLPDNAPGKNKALAFLKDRYPDIEKLNSAWETHYTSFNQLKRKRHIKLPWRSAKAWSDKESFVRIVARRYFTACRDAIRAHDPNHLLLGARFHGGGAPAAVVEEAGKTMDVISVNYYPINPNLDKMISSSLHSLSTENFFAKYAEASNRPILISETSFKALDSGLPNSKGASIPLKTQQDRADHFAQYLKAYLKTNYIIGYHWYCYMDEPATGRFDGENSNYGLVNEQDDPYKILTETMNQENARVYAFFQGKQTE